MDNVQLKLDDQGKGSFYIMKGDMQMGEMEISISGSQLTVYHTEVAKEAEGKGLGKRLIEAMSNYAREKTLMVTPLCSYVSTQFKRHPKENADIWNREETNT